MHAAAVNGVHVPPPQLFGTLAPPQVSPAGQAAEQLRDPPQPLPTIPQYWPPGGEQVVGTQLAEPQMFATPEPPQVWPAGQAKVQSIVPPHPSPIMPQ